MVWKKNNYSRSQIKKAGRILAKGPQDAAEESKAIEILDNWRASHAYPLHVIATYLRFKAKGTDIIVVQRLKRLDSIIAKLKRKRSIGLYDMQDLAGCRVIAPSIDEVYRLCNELSTSRIKHRHHKTDDYIQGPKSSGYRSVHMIYKYHNDSNQDYEGMFVEIQFRTQLQHLWSTAVETMGIYTSTNLKAGLGPEKILRFFALVSSVFAHEEGQPLVPNTPTSVEEIIEEIKVLCLSENILPALRAIRVATQEIVRRGNNAQYYILALNFTTSRLTIKEYSALEMEIATRDYHSIENQKAENKINAVLVSATSIDELERAYPNYFSDIGAFVVRIETMIM